jgi:putative Mg2+ transporter-C (MgtC) family protein
MNGVEQFADTTLVMLAKLILAVVLGGIIGTERSVMARQAAGTRTFGLVALGACLFVITANYVDIAHVGIVNFDPMRMAAAIVTGIGFLGGGLIIFKGQTQHGITTAAGLWISAAVGIAVGFGLYGIAIFSTILVLIVFTGMWYLENRFKQWFKKHEIGSEHDAGHGL